MTQRRITAIAATALVALVVASCGASDESAKFDSVGNEISSAGGGGVGSESDEGVVVSPPGSPPSDPPSVGSGGLSADGEVLLDASAYEAGDLPETASPVTNLGLRAGSVDDNDGWAAYLGYLDDLREAGVTAGDIDVRGRQLLTVVDRNDEPVLGAEILVTDAAGDEVARLRTYADGRAVFLGSVEVDPTTQSRPRYEATVRYGDAEVTEALSADAVTHTIRLDVARADTVDLDVHFLIDTTGSMGDEIEQLKANVADVADQVADLEGAGEVRYGMTLYRDVGDAYVTRTTDLGHDIDAFGAELAAVTADGGGDVPEALSEALHEAVSAPSWGGTDTVKLVFLIADAPPHLEREGAPDYVDDLRAAAASGIKVFPVASSGLDDLGELVFRQLAQVTMGRFVFLTYGADGAPGDDTPHHVDDYSVLSLDDLVVKLVAEEVAHQA